MIFGFVIFEWYFDIEIILMFIEALVVKDYVRKINNTFKNLYIGFFLQTPSYDIDELFKYFATTV